MGASLPDNQPDSRGWQRHALGGVAQWLSGGTPSESNPAFWKGSLPWASPKDMKVLHLGETEDSITEAAAVAGSRTVPSGAILLVVRGMILAHTFPVCLTTRRMAFNQDIKALLPDGNTEGTFLAHWFVGHAPQMLGLVTESTHGTKRIDLHDLTAYRIDLPPLPEQRRIAAILDTLDEAIRRTEQVIEKLKEVKQGLLHDLPTRGIDDNGELRPPPDEAPHLFKDSPLGRIPRGWASRQFGELLRVLYRYPSYYGIQYVGRGVPEVRGELVRNDGTLECEPSAYRHISESTAAQFVCVRLKPDDFVMTVRGTLGKVARVPRWLEGAVITANLLRIGFDANIVKVDWMKQYLLSARWQDALDLACSATTIKTIQVPALSAIRISVPTSGEQERIARLLCLHDARIGGEVSGLDKLRTLKNGLMDDLLTGRVRVPPTSEVTA